MRGAWLSALFHAPCRLCGNRVPSPLLGLACPACWAALPALAAPRCPACALPSPPGLALPRGKGDLPESLLRASCRDCRRLRPAFDRTLAVAPYRGAWRRLISACKFDGHSSLLRPMASRLAEAWVAGGWQLPDAACSVPPQGRGLARRGFDPASDLGRRACRSLGIPWKGGLLGRARSARRQSELDRRQRLRNMRGAFEARLPTGLRGGRILLVDDILTTGATADACARALREAGAGSVELLVLARSL